MIFWKLFYTFCKIGIFNFGGGYAMIALIQNEVVTQQGWMTTQEFTDIVAISQMTPGPIGINVATYAGYTAVINAGYDTWLGILGAILSSFAVILLPFVFMLIITKFLIKHRNNQDVNNVFASLRITVIGLIAAAALILTSAENFGLPSQNLFQFILSIIIFVTVFWASYKYKTNPILLILLCGLIGFFAYY